MSTHTIEVLFFDGCPNLTGTIERVRAAANDELDFAVRLVRVESEDEAREKQFLGSPSVRVDGVDVEPSARERTDFGLQCRVYPQERGGFEGMPSVDMIRRALEPGAGATALADAPSGGS